MTFLIGSMILFLIIGIPIAFALGFSSLLYVVFFLDVSPMVVVQQVSSGADSMVLLALPFFMLAGEIMNASGITQRLTRAVLAVIGPPRGGLSYVVIFVNVLMAMVSGAAIASAAAVGTTMVPVMEKKGYSRDYAAALNAAAATMGGVIPPSVGFILYASVSGASVGKLFLAGTIPGLLIAVGACILCAIQAQRHRFPAGEKRSFKEIRDSLVEAGPALLMPVIILGGIFGGLVTPTEAGALAAAYGLVAGLVIYRTLRLSDLPGILLVTARRTVSIMFIIACASCFGFLISREINADEFTGLFQAVTQNRHVLMLLLTILIILLGTVLEGSSIMIILTPLLLPILKAYQIDPVHFGVVFLVGLMIGLLTPPVGILLFVMAGISNSPVQSIIKHLRPFYIMFAILLLLLMYIPELSLWLVEKAGGGLK